MHGRGSAQRPMRRRCQQGYRTTSCIIGLAIHASRRQRPATQPSYHAVDIANRADDARATPNQPSHGSATPARNAAAAMSVSKLVGDAERGLGESQNQRDARVEALWAKLDPGRTGELDLKGLQKGFRRIDHPMKNADELLRQIMDEVDTNRDGIIQYQEFCTFVEGAERQLLLLFKTIDKDGNGKLDMKELQTAFRTAGLTVSSRRLSDFFNDMDENHDGYVSFDEWRNFLLFMPARDHDSQLRAVLSYYYSVVNVTPEGDSIVSEETLEGLGTDGSSYSFIQSFFGSLLRVASPAPFATSPPPPTTPTTLQNTERAHAEEEALPAQTEKIDAAEATTDTIVDAAATRRRKSSTDAMTRQDGDGTPDEHLGESQSSSGKAVAAKKKYRLTDFAPDPGYFLAGAIAGGVSRTATAPLDRLKVYLLVNTSSSSETAVTAIKHGRPVDAVKNATRPIREAVRDLYRSGGLRGFFAGNGLNVVKIMPETAIKFGSYEAAKRALANFEGHGDPRQINSYSKFTAGGVAGMIAQFCIYPLDTLKFRLQCETVKDGLTGSALVRQTAIRMYADGGVRACYRGVTMGLIGMFPYSAIDMAMFELLKKTYQGYYAQYAGCHEDDAEPGNIATGIIGATSGAIGATVVYPLNVVRTRLQTQGTVMHQATYTGIWDVTQKTIQREGYRGLYKGLTPNLLKVAPALSITWVVHTGQQRPKPNPAAAQMQMVEIKTNRQRGREARLWRLLKKRALMDGPWYSRRGSHKHAGTAAPARSHARWRAAGRAAGPASWRGSIACAADEARSGYDSRSGGGCASAAAHWAETGPWTEAPRLLDGRCGNIEGGTTGNGGSVRCSGSCSAARAARSGSGDGWRRRLGSTEVGKQGRGKADGQLLARVWCKQAGVLDVGPLSLLFHPPCIPTGLAEPRAKPATYTALPTYTTDSSTMPDLGQDASHDERDALSPTDGYFGASSSPSEGEGAASCWPWRQYPHHQRQQNAPTVLVEDPGLRAQGAADKAREAEEERLINDATCRTASSPCPPQVSAATTGSSSSSQGGPASPSAAAAPAQPPFAASRHHRGSVDEGEPLRFPGHGTRLPYLYTPANRGETTSTSPPHRRNRLDASPTCSPSPPSPPPRGHAQHRQGYQTFPSPDIMGVPEEHPPRQPESMGGPPHGPPSPRWPRVKESVGSPNLRRRIKTILGVLVIFSVIFAMLGTLNPSSSSHHKVRRPSTVTRLLAFLGCRMNTGIDNGSVREPDVGGDGDLEWRPSPGCRNTPYAFSGTTAAVRFGGNRDLDIRQEIEENSDTSDWRQPRVFGHIILRPAGGDASEGSIELQVISNDENLRVRVDSDVHDDHHLFKMTTPRAIEWGSSSSDGPCIQMRATLWVPRKAHLRAFTLNAVHLDVNVIDGLILDVADETKIQTVVGHFRTSLPEDVNEEVIPYTLRSRKIRIKTVGGDVQGWFPLYDLLKISSASGDITAQVAPKPVDEKSPASAVLDISSISGHIKVTEPLAGALGAGKPDRKLPARDYITRLSTTSGQIQGEVAAGSEGKFGSTSGNTVLRVLPIFDEDTDKSGSKPRLTTHSVSGDWRVAVLEPLWTGTSGTSMHTPGQPSPDDDDASHKDTHEPLVIVHPDVELAKHHRYRSSGASRNADEDKTPALSFLESRHGSVSGTLRLFYPASWEGTLRARSIGGNIEVTGDGVEIIRRGRGWARLVEGRKGEGDSEIDVETMSGNVELVVGGESS
ncbi:Calcium-binding mitochondrial carrier SAL1 [Tolypocladium capitatum]|uniref:Mitochondrial thiamine pyrophosphate carrier 1 n=1 Tax=Tolypocladium capitatum TaxID=45235 RepID=A0A2K3Q8N4_9HYPO|nr:Calcium-binding mitochondrial carrier SAL1 [Tolypocladium capitatum]